jgi:SPP1 family predicted phage head-tail adaptor
MQRAGQLDRRVELRHLVLGTQDTNGTYPDATHTAYATVWARKEEVSGREYFSAQAKQAELTVRFTIRYRDDVLATDRLTCEGRDYELTMPPSEGGRRETLTLFARVVNP